MASVTGKTAESIDGEFDTMVVSLRVSDTGRLIYKTQDGTETDAGPIVAPDIAVDAAHPVGSIFISAVPTNPLALLGIGVWARFGVGRTLVSQQAADPDFDVAEETGGEKTHTLDLTEIPSHAHSITHTHSMTITYNTAGASNNEDYQRVTSLNWGSGGAVDHIGNTSASSAPNSGNAGGGLPHNNMPPYIVVYMWKRTA
jgi:hypothetical protein